MYKDLLLRLVGRVADEADLVLETRGSTTFKEKRLLQGAEPDTCFYVENAKRIIGKGDIDLAKDPPPDIIVEVDVSHQSTGKLSFYSAIGVPEIWRYDERQVRILHLVEGRYVEMSSSLTFPVLTDKVLTDVLEQSKIEGQSAALRTFRQWLREI
jgi:Uma2 family endonuclease